MLCANSLYVLFMLIISLLTYLLSNIHIYNVGGKLNVKRRAKKSKDTAICDTTW